MDDELKKEVAGIIGEEAVYIIKTGGDIAQLERMYKEVILTFFPKTEKAILESSCQKFLANAEKIIYKNQGGLLQ